MLPFLRPVPERVVRTDIPYFSQWESPELVAGILAGKTKAQDDPKWQVSGAVTPDEYEVWSKNGCGMACTKMILAAHHKTVLPLVLLAEKALQYGAYKQPLESSPGMFYRPYATFLQKEYNLKAQVTGRLTIDAIIKALARGKYVIASVSPDIRHPKSTPAKKGGHLVLVVGYDKPKRMLYIHNPSGDTAASQENAAVSFDDFAKFSAQRGLIIG